MKAAIINFLTNLLSFFYPRFCPACGKALQSHEICICLYCLYHLPESNLINESDKVLDSIFAGRIKIEATVALLLYKKGNNVQKLIYALKYKGQKQIGYIFGYELGKRLNCDSRFSDINLILPVPLHYKKERKRGYNQAVCIAKGISDAMIVPYSSDGFIRAEFTETQTKKSRISRWRNVKEVFQVTDERYFINKKILICDDVLTTGATIEATAQKLLDIEGVTVVVATLASVI